MVKCQMIFLRSGALLTLFAPPGKHPEFASGVECFIISPHSILCHGFSCQYIFEVLELVTCYFSADPYVKVSLMCDGRRLKKRKTSTKRNTLNPVYNEAIVFDVPPENIDQISLLIAVMDYDRLVS